MNLASILFSFSGRIGRLDYLFSLLVSNIVAALLYGFIANEAVFNGHHVALPPLAFIALLVVAVVNIWSVLAVTVKRLRDLGHGGANIIWIIGTVAVGSYFPLLVPLVCFFSGAILLWLFLMPGEDGENRYGKVTHL